MPNINEDAWLVEQDIPPLAGQPDPGGAAGGFTPGSQPGMPNDPMGTGDQQAEVPPDVPPQDISDDPQSPDMPEEHAEDDFEVWKIKFVKESIKGDPNILEDMLNQVMDRELDPSQDKFVNDNLQIIYLRQDANIKSASDEIRKRIKKSLDRTNPATSVIEHITAVLEEQPLMNEIYIKTSGLGVGKSDAHRKFIASITGSVQLGSGANNEDLIFEEVDYSIRMSTRMNSKWGDVNLGRWSLKEDDPERYLKEAELERLEGGSPEERDVLRRRIVMESIGELFDERAFIINVVGQDGTVQHIGWDLGTSLKAAFLEGKLIVKTRDSDVKEAFIDKEGSIVPIPSMSVYYIKESDQLGGTGETINEELEFLQHRNGMLYLAAPLPLLQEAAMNLQGMVYKETMFQGNPSDLIRIKRNVPSLPEMILRR